jgi:hypothetical protein
VTNTETIESWLRDTLKDERWFRNGEPTWDYLPQVEEAKAERLRRSRLLRKHGHADVGAKLGSCEPNRRCYSGCCPECGRAFQRLFASNAAAMCTASNDYAVATLVGKSRRSAGRLASLDIERVRRHVLKALGRSHAGIAFGGIDFSFNEIAGRGYEGHWKPHLHLLIHNAYRNRWEKLLREAFARSEKVPRPVRVTSWDGRIEVFGYMLKTDFERRIRVTSYRFARGRRRRCLNTSYDRLCANERAELFSYMDQIGLASRALLFGVRPFGQKLEAA